MSKLNNHASIMNHPKTNQNAIWIAELSISTLFLYRDQRFRGYCLLSFNDLDATNIDTLSDEQYQTFMMNMRSASKAIRASMKPDHMNYELLGNMDPHLHWHIIPRYKTDPRWGFPIWEGRKTEWVVLTDEAYRDIVQQIQAQLA
jgi:diadenosine tetraphosphate (Ap4A) HIT family hydrolase